MPPGHANLATDIAMCARKPGWLQPPAPVDAAIPQDRRTGSSTLVNGQTVATMANMSVQTVIAEFRRHRRQPRQDRTGQEVQGVDSVPDTRRLDLRGSEAAVAREGLPRLRVGCGLLRSVHDIALSAGSCDAWWAGRMQVHGASIRQVSSGLSPGSRSAWRRFQPDAPRFVPRSPVRPYLAMPPAPCHPFHAVGSGSCGRLNATKEISGMTGTSEQRIAEALERIDGNLGRIADVLEEGGLNDIADAFTIIAMAVSGMEPELEDDDLPEH